MARPQRCMTPRSLAPRSRFPSPGPGHREPHPLRDDGRFSIGLRISVSDGAPTRLKVKCRINKKINDEVESTVEDPGQLKLL